MKKLIIPILILSLIFSPAVFAADHYIREGATGSADGSNWTNAWTDLPSSSTMIRGDTYYVADGNYNGHQFSKAESGELYIYILKATAAAHGTETGWDNDYGDGQAIFTRTIYFLTGYWVWSGVTRNEADWSDESSYGFKIIPLGSCAQVQRLAGLNVTGFSRYQVDHVDFLYTSLVNCGSSYDYDQKGFTSDPNWEGDAYRSSNINLSYNYWKDSSTNVSVRRFDNSLIEGNYFAGNWSSAANHGQQFVQGNGSSNNILRNNVFKDSYVYILGAHVTACAAAENGTIASVTENTVTVTDAGWTPNSKTNHQLYVSGSGKRYKVQSNTSDTLTVLPAKVVTEGGAGGNTYELKGCGAPNDNWKIYNNLVIGGGLSGGWGSADSGYVDVCTNWQVYNNSHIGVTFGGYGMVFVGRLTSSAKQSFAYNNLTYDSSNPQIPKYTTDAVVNDYNGYYSCTGTIPNETHGFIVASPGDPYTNSAANPPDLTLAAVGGALAIDGGTPVDIDPAVDKDGVGRPQGAAWDIGAYEWFTGGGEDYVAPAGSCTVKHSKIYKNEAELDCTFTDDGGVVGYRYRIGAAVTTSTSGTAATFPQTIKGEFSPGANWVCGGAYDAAGNTGSECVWVDYLQVTAAGVRF